MTKVKNVEIDVVDLYERLKKDFPHIEFQIENVEKQIGSSVHTFHKFKLARLLNQKFETPIKTTISMLKNSYITESEYTELQSQIFQSFGVTKLLGLN